MESQCVSAVRMDTDAIQDLIRGSSIPWMPATVSSYLEVLLSQGSCDVDKVVLTFSPKGLLWSFSLHNVQCESAGNSMHSRSDTDFSADAGLASRFHIVPGAEAFYQNAASLIKVSIFIKQERADLAFEVAGRLCSSVTEIQESIL